MMARIVRCGEIADFSSRSLSILLLERGGRESEREGYKREGVKGFDLLLMLHPHPPYASLGYPLQQGRG